MEDLSAIHKDILNPNPDLDWFLQETIKRHHDEVKLAGGGYHEKEANRLWDMINILRKPVEEMTADEKSMANSFLRSDFLGTVHSKDIKETGKSGGQYFERYIKVTNILSGLGFLNK